MNRVFHTVGFQVIDKALPMVNMVSLKKSKKLKAFFPGVAVKHG